MKPQTQAEIDLWKNLADACGLTVDEFTRQWNAGARYADEHWADNPPDRGQDMNQPGILHDKHGDPIWEKKQ